MALSPDAAALKEQALHAADKTLAGVQWRHSNQPAPHVRVVIAAAWLDGYKTGQMEHDRYVDEAHHYLLGLAGGDTWIRTS